MVDLISFSILFFDLQDVEEALDYEAKQLNLANGGVLLEVMNAERKSILILQAFLTKNRCFSTVVTCTQNSAKYRNGSPGININYKRIHASFGDA